MRTEQDVRERITQLEADYSDVLNMTPREIGLNPYWLQMARTGVGRLKELYWFLGEERPEYPCLHGWAETLAELGVSPWRDRVERGEDVEHGEPRVPA